MASSRTTIHGPLWPRVLLPSRLIPGGSTAGVSGRKLSAFSAGELWRWPSFGELATGPRAGFWSSLVHCLLPEPAARNQCPKLLFQVAADVLLIVLGFTTIIFFRGLDWTGVPVQVEFATGLHLAFPGPELGLLLLYGALFTLLGYSQRLYHPETVERPRHQRIVLAKSLFWSTVLVGAAWAASGVHLVPASTLAAAAPVNFLLLLMWRTHCRRSLARSTNDTRNVLIVGAGNLGRRLASHLDQATGRKHVVRGFLDEHEAIGGDIRGRIADLAQVARREFVDEIIVTLPLRSEIAQQAIWEARRNRIDVKLVPDLLGFDPYPVVLEKFGDIPVLTLSEEPLPAVALLLKRVVDVTLSSIGLILVSPLLAGIAVAIKMDSPGLVLYRAPRLGLKGRHFLCYKFRTMAANADKLKDQLRQFNERKGAMFKITNDPRVTRVGRILRRYSLDEVPQLWNILRGEMSLVGPRPHPLDDFERYALEDMQRLEVTPGLTGLWQVTARGDPSFAHSMALDRQYIGRWSLGMDFWILCKTFGAVLKGEGA
jgi:exopolysaccharide biosynthesis polyprenyl glycosylphosphotransferase